MQTGQLFLLYDDPARTVDNLLDEVAKKSTPFEMRDEYDVMHRLWPVSDAAFIKRIQAAMADKKLVIADGHHRYETALAYRNEARAKGGAPTGGAQASEYAMMTFINTHSKGLLILPTHRVVGNLGEFRFRKISRNNGSVLRLVFVSVSECRGKSRGMRGIPERPGEPQTRTASDRSLSGASSQTGAGAYYLFALHKDADLETLLPDVSEAQQGLDVVLLHRVLLEKGLGITAEAVTAEKNVSYEREMETALERVDRGEAQVAFLLIPVDVQQVADIALGGDVMPQKSTDFYPKLMSGIAIFRPEGNL